METEGAARVADSLSQAFALDERADLDRPVDVAAEVAPGRWASGRTRDLAGGGAEGRETGPPGSPLRADLTARARSGAELFARHNGAAYLAPDDLTLTEVHPRRIAMVGSCLLDQWRLHERNASGCAVDFFLTNNLARLPELDREQVRAWDFQLVQLPLRGVLHDHPFWRLAYDDVEGHKSLLDQAKRAIDAFLDTQMVWNREHGLLTFACNFLVPQKNPDGALLPRHDVRNPQYVVQQLNEHLERAVRASPNAYVLDLDQIASIVGKRGLQDDTVVQLAHGALLDPWGPIGGRLEPVFPMADYYDLSTRAEFVEAVWAELVSMYRAVRQADPVKLVVVDLDDTLWRGVSGEMADIGPHMTETGQLGLVEALMFLRRRGVLLAICSQNEAARIREIWPKIFGPRLSLDDFAAVAINWRPKVENMTAMLRELNLLARHVVFIDDNPAERAAMKQAFPEMRILGRHPYYLRRTLLWSSETQVASITAESGRRTEMVQAQIARETQRSAMRRDEFLDMAAPRAALFELRSAEHPRFDRCLELINKTNQFNTTGERRTREEIEDLFCEGGSLFFYEAADAFAVYGLVGVVLVRGLTIAQWAMSCRVLGYGIETAAMARLVEHLRRNGPVEIAGRLVETPMNFPCRDLFSGAGFTAAGGGLWRLSQTVTPAVPAHVRIAPVEPSTALVQACRK